MQKNNDFQLKANGRETGQDINPARNKTKENKHEKNKQDAVLETWCTNAHGKRMKKIK